MCCSPCLLILSALKVQTWRHIMILLWADNTESSPSLRFLSTTSQCNKRADGQQPKRSCSKSLCTSHIKALRWQQHELQHLLCSSPVNENQAEVFSSSKSTWADLARRTNTCVSKHGKPVKGAELQAEGWHTEKEACFLIAWLHQASAMHGAFILNGKYEQRRKETYAWIKHTLTHSCSYTLGFSLRLEADTNTEVHGSQT